MILYKLYYAWTNNLDTRYIDVHEFGVYVNISMGNRQSIRSICKVSDLFAESIRSFSGKYPIFSRKVSDPLKISDRLKYPVIWKYSILKPKSIRTFHEKYSILWKYPILKSMRSFESIRSLSRKVSDPLTESIRS